MQYVFLYVRVIILRVGERWLNMGSGCCSSAFRLLAVDLALPNPFSSPTPSSSYPSSDEDIQDLLDAGAHVVPPPPARSIPIPESTLWPMHISRLPLPGVFSPEHRTLPYDPMPMRI